MLFLAICWRSFFFFFRQIYASKLKLHPVVVICVLYMAEHLVGVQGLIIAVPCAVFVINNLILGEGDERLNSSGTHSGDTSGSGIEKSTGNTGPAQHMHPLIT